LSSNSIFGLLKKDIFMFAYYKIVTTSYWYVFDVHPYPFEKVFQ